MQLRRKEKAADKMIKIEHDYKSEAIFPSDMSSSWDKERMKTLRVSLFGLTLFRRTEHLHIDYESMGKNGMGFK